LIIKTEYIGTDLNSVGKQKHPKDYDWLNTDGAGTPDVDLVTDLFMDHHDISTYGGAYGTFDAIAIGHVVDQNDALAAVTKRGTRGLERGDVYNFVDYILDKDTHTDEWLPVE